MSTENSEVKTDIERVTSDFINFKSKDYSELLKNFDIAQAKNNELIKSNQEMNKIIEQINIKQKYRLATDDKDDISTGEMVKKLIDTDIILKALNDKFMNLAN